MANAAEDSSVYYIPDSGWYPIALAVGLIITMMGLGSYLNAMSAGESNSLTQTVIGFGIVSVVLYCWFTKVIAENQQGLVNSTVKQSYVWGMGWFIFSEVMFFAAFFGALYYVRAFAVPWLGGDGAKSLTGDYLWPDFEAVWPVMNNPGAADFPGPEQNMVAPNISNWLSYLPFWNTVILLSSSVTVHWAHSAIKAQNRSKIIIWLGITVLLGIIFLGLQVEEYVIAYSQMGLTLGSGIYGSTFFLLTGFHGFHVTLGTVILFVQFIRSIKGHFSANDCFGFEAASWYWHFVDVVWVGLFIVVYVL
ncbi:MAG: cytochrome c oxidase subunit 3 [Gammaproteobacteria bacterium]|nr:cytochrome c oxidase subunit 3 [Gammaproteobacteria bacterium]